MPLQHLDTEADFDKALSTHGMVLIDFYAQWCGPCKMLAPELEQLATNQPSIAFFKVDVDINTDVSDRENISAMPTIRLYRSGKLFHEVVGANLSEIRQAVATMDVLEPN